jgi:hypothetical protein
MLRDLVERLIVPPLRVLRILKGEGNLFALTRGMLRILEFFKKSPYNIYKVRIKVSNHLFAPRFQPGAKRSEKMDVCGACAPHTSIFSGISGRGFE